jgi:hypothetical protein
VTLTPLPGTPRPLVVAAALAALQGLFLLGYGVLEIGSVSSGRVTMGLTTAVFFLLCGLGLTWGAWALTHGRSIARSPILLAQLIQLGLAYNFWDSGSRLVAAILALVGVSVIVGLVHPASMAALESGDQS